MGAQPLPIRTNQPYSRLETITPEVAERYLEANTHNRNVQHAVVGVYARDMSAGRWQFTGEPLKFAVDGTLLDGQHRLRAVVQSGVTVEMFVAYNIYTAAQSAMDTGKKRSVGDALKLAGYAQGNRLGALARLIATDGGRTGRTISNDEVLEMLGRDPSLETVMSGSPGQAVGGAIPAVVDYVWWCVHKIDHVATDAFFNGLVTLADLPKGSPILALHTRFVTPAARDRGRTERREHIALFFTAWNAWRRGETRRLIKLARDREGRLVVPEPV